MPQKYMWWIHNSEELNCCLACLQMKQHLWYFRLLSNNSHLERWNLQRCLQNSYYNRKTMGESKVQFISTQNYGENLKTLLRWCRQPDSRQRCYRAGCVVYWNNLWDATRCPFAIPEMVAGQQHTSDSFSGLHLHCPNKNSVSLPVGRYLS